MLVIDDKPDQGTGSWEDFMATPWQQRRDRREPPTNETWADPLMPMSGRASSTYRVVPGRGIWAELS